MRRQSDHFNEYEAVISSLHARGLAYRCFRTRREVAAQSDRAPHAPEPVFRGASLDPGEEAERLAAGEPHAWRLSIPAARDWLAAHRHRGRRAERLGYTETAGGGDHHVAVALDAISDVVVGRKDSPASYHLAACHDDAKQGVTHVIRGEDLVASTPVHVLLQELMGWPRPVYHHHPLLLDENGKRFAKRDRSLTLRHLRESGMTRDEIRRMTGGI